MRNKSTSIYASSNSEESWSHPSSCDSLPLFGWANGSVFSPQSFHVHHSSRTKVTTTTKKKKDYQLLEWQSSNERNGHPTTLRDLPPVVAVVAPLTVVWRRRNQLHKPWNHPCIPPNQALTIRVNQGATDPANHEAQLKRLSGFQKCMSENMNEVWGTIHPVVQARLSGKLFMCTVGAITFENDTI